MSADADLLRRAAALIRERAEAVYVDAASRDPWRVTQAEGGNRDARRTLGTFSLINDGHSEVAIVRGFSDERTATANHIASWHPAVALAVADWLDAAADDDRPRTPVDHAALAVAAAYLGDQPWRSA